MRKELNGLVGQFGDVLLPCPANEETDALLNVTVQPVDAQI